MGAADDQGGGGVSFDLRRPWAPPRPVAVPEGALAYLAALLAAVLPDPAAVAAALLERFGHLGAVLAASADELVLTPGVTDAAAALVVAAHAAAAFALEERIGRDPIADWPALERWLRLNLGGLPAERLLALYLDRKDGLIRHEVLGEGTVDHVPLYPREVARRALLYGASAVVLAHNHPSGNPTPSPVDVEMTRKVADGLALFGVALHDHAVVGRERVVSMRARGLL
jgi:DNA repair protein RadC